MTETTRLSRDGHVAEWLDERCAHLLDQSKQWPANSFTAADLKSRALEIKSAAEAIRALAAQQAAHSKASVTPEMRLAGAAVLYHQHEHKLPEDAAEAVYKAMAARGSGDGEVRAILIDAVRRAGEQFRFYQRQHREKGTVDGDVKAITNGEFAEMCEAALARALGEDEGGSRG